MNDMEVRGMRMSYISLREIWTPLVGYTALHDAAWHGHAEAAEVLLEAGANPMLRGHDGCTAYDLAVRYGYKELAERILSAMKGYTSE